MIAINFARKGSVDLSALNRFPTGLATSAIEIGIRVIEGYIVGVITAVMHEA
jgi:hypothetical protein